MVTGFNPVIGFTFKFSLLVLYVDLFIYFYFYLYIHFISSLLSAYILKVSGKPWHFLSFFKVGYICNIISHKHVRFPVH